MAEITELGYIGISVSDAQAWKTYATEVVGLELVEEPGESDRFYLRMDEMHHRIVVHTNGNDDLEYVGWRVTSPKALKAMQAQLTEAGVDFRVASDAECRERHVLGLLKLTDPGGNPTEIYCTPRVEADRAFHPGRPLWGKFIAGSQGLGHMILRQEDPQAAYDFYTEVFGMDGGIEYKLPMPGGGEATPWFVHCNNRQHSLAFGIPNMPKRINHLNIEYTELDDLGKAHDIVRHRDIPVAIKMGKHANDKALSFYHATPSGWLMELGWNGRETPRQEEYYVADIWGHEMEGKGYGMDLEMNREG